jgi:hypothetical protein
MARFLSVAAVVGHLQGLFFRMVSRGALGVVILAGTDTEAAVISEQYSVPLGINTLGRDNGQGPAYITGGTLYRCDRKKPSADFDEVSGDRSILVG